MHPFLKGECWALEFLAPTKILDSRLSSVIKTLNSYNLLVTLWTWVIDSCEGHLPILLVPDNSGSIRALKRGAVFTSIPEDR